MTDPNPESWGSPTEPLSGRSRRPELEWQLAASENFLSEISRRRSVRDFSSETVDRRVIENCLLAAGRAPSGANQQPWHFVAVGDAATKRRIRQAAEREEEEFYQRRAPQAWLDALQPLGTDQHKPFLETAPWLIAIFAETYQTAGEGDEHSVKNYYVNESVGIACGFLLAALNSCGLATLTHTPSPMRFLNEILGRPKQEKPFLLLVVGYPSIDCTVPKIGKKTLDEISTFVM
ncbi:MAG TPA: nitroreductase family protein [Planctomycetaceae bacterium]|nr:nitroreductase family protein [Planctomycetaceae bacterium]